MLPFKALTIAFSQFLDNEDNINKEERAFVETNPGLFNPEPFSPGKKRTNKDKDASTSKKRKASSDEVKKACNVKQFFHQDSTKEHYNLQRIFNLQIYIFISF